MEKSPEVELDWAKFLDEMSDEHFGMSEPVENGTMEYAIGRMKDGRFFYGLYYELNGVNDPKGSVYWFNDDDIMLKQLLAAGLDPDNDDFSAEIVMQLMVGYQDL